jgi:DNA-binding NtrC family response regulator
MTTALENGKAGSAVANKARVLVIAGASSSDSIVEALTATGHAVTTANDFVAAQAQAASTPPDLVLVDATIAAGTPTDFAWPAWLLVTGESSTRATDPFLGVIHGDSASETLDAVVAAAMALGQARVRCAELERMFEGMRDGSVMIGRSPTMRRLQGVLRRAAECDATVLIEGPAGSGKSLAARVIHCKSRRSNRPLVAASCSGLDGDALTQAMANANGTTLVLEDVDQLPVAAQAALVRHLKERPQPGTESQQPRIIATTAAHLPELIARGAFREDLYYRLHVFPIVVPSLRERTEDIGLLAATILESCTAQGNKTAGFSASSLMLLESLPWPGNVAQLEHVVRRAHALAGGGQIDRLHLLGPSTGLNGPAETRTRMPQPTDDDSEVSEETVRPFEEEEQRLLGRALRATKGNVRRAAQLLGIGRATLYRKIQQYKLRLN